MGYVFADGHAEIHEWVDSQIPAAAGTNNLQHSNEYPGGPRDYAWVTNQIAAFR